MDQVPRSIFGRAVLWTVEIILVLIILGLLLLTWLPVIVGPSPGL